MENGNEQSTSDYPSYLIALFLITLMMFIPTLILAMAEILPPIFLGLNFFFIGLVASIIECKKLNVHGLKSDDTSNSIVLICCGSLFYLPSIMFLIEGDIQLFFMFLLSGFGISIIGVPAIYYNHLQNKGNGNP